MRGRETILGVGDIACALSHQRAWQRFADSKQPWAFFAEDDLALSTEAHNFLENSDWIPEDADVIKAETFMEPTLVSRQNNRQVFGRTLARLNAQHLGTAGYFLSAPTAERLLTYAKTYCEPADQIIFGAELDMFHSLRIYQIDPAFGVQIRFLDTVKDDADLTSTRLDTNAELGEPIYLRALGQMKKPRGWAKVWRELSRPFVRAFRRLMKMWDAHRLRVVPFR